MKRMLTRSVCLALSFLVALAVAERLSGWRGLSATLVQPPMPFLTSVADTQIRQLPAHIVPKPGRSRISISGTVPMRQNLIACIVVNEEGSDVWKVWKIPTLVNRGPKGNWLINEDLNFPLPGRGQSKLYRITIWSEWIAKRSKRGTFCDEGLTTKTGLFPPEISSPGFATLELRR